MLMDLKKLVDIGWEKEVISLYQRYKKEIKYGDQCLINMYTALHPGNLKLINLIICIL